MRSGVVVMLIVVAMVPSCYWPDTSRYEGDGTISQFGLPLNRGVIVELGSFDVTRSYERRYSLAGLPTPRAMYMIGLVPEHESSTREHDPITAKFGKRCGRISLAITTANGEVVRASESALSNLSWRWVKKEQLGYIATKPNRSVLRREDFASAGNQLPFWLEVKYVPDDPAASGSLRIWIAGGGTT